MKFSINSMYDMRVVPIVWRPGVAKHCDLWQICMFENKSQVDDWFVFKESFLVFNYEAFLFVLSVAGKLFISYVKHLYISERVFHKLF